MSKSIEDRLTSQSPKIHKKIIQDQRLNDMGMKVVPSASKEFIRNLFGVRTYWISKGGQIDQSQVREEIWQLPRDVIAFNIAEFEDKLHAEPKIYKQIRKLGRSSLLSELYSRVITLAVSTMKVPKDIPWYDAKTLAQVSQQTDKPSDVIVIGTVAALTQCSPWLRGFKENVIQIPLSGSEIKGMSDDFVILINKNSLYIRLYGGPKSKAFVEQSNWYAHYLYRTDVSLALTSPARLVRV